MKKGIFIVGCIVLLLCSIATVGTGVWFFVLREDPHKAFSEAVDLRNNGDYFQFEEEGGFTISVLGTTVETEVEGTGKIDIQNNKSYAKATTKINGERIESEEYVIGDTTYTSANGSEFEESETSEYENIFQDILSYVEKEDYEVLKSEAINDVTSFHYNIKLNEAHLDSFVQIMAEGFIGGVGGGDFTTEDVEIDEGYLEVWVAKNNYRITKMNLEIEELEFTVKQGENQATITISDFYDTQYLSKWGEAFDITAPE